MRRALAPFIAALAFALAACTATSPANTSPVQPTTTVSVENASPATTAVPSPSAEPKRQVSGVAGELEALCRDFQIGWTDSFRGDEGIGHSRASDKLKARLVGAGLTLERFTFDGEAWGINLGRDYSGCVYVFLTGTPLTITMVGISSGSSRSSMLRGGVLCTSRSADGTMPGDWLELLLAGAKSPHKGSYSVATSRGTTVTGKCEF